MTRGCKLTDISARTLSPLLCIVSHLCCSLFWLLVDCASRCRASRAHQVQWRGLVQPQPRATGLRLCQSAHSSRRHLSSRRTSADSRRARPSPTSNRFPAARCPRPHEHSVFHPSVFLVVVCSSPSYSSTFFLVRCPLPVSCPFSLFFTV